MVLQMKVPSGKDLQAVTVCAAAIPAALASQPLAQACHVFAAPLSLVPDRRIETPLADTD